jgi:hypothetical protein
LGKRQSVVVYGGGSDPVGEFLIYESEPGRVRHPRVAAISFGVKDLDGLLKRMRAAGVSTASAGGKVVRFTPKTRSIFVEDPNGIKVERYETLQNVRNEKGLKQLPDK